MLSTTDVLDLMRARGHRMPLTEGGPHLVGQLTAEDLLNELFVTIAPSLPTATTYPGRASPRRRSCPHNITRRTWSRQTTKVLPVPALPVPPLPHPLSARPCLRSGRPGRGAASGRPSAPGTR
ncbi:dihydrofolate reductase family protein [Actinoallomurus oryzae]|uniref:dihydrofolate reductase family protein n=1 Tax=Actinoallomurus oryzae TaxID=502180 RepID=UPI003CD081C6